MYQKRWPKTSSSWVASWTLILPGPTLPIPPPWSLQRSHNERGKRYQEKIAGLKWKAGQLTMELDPPQEGFQT